MFSPNIGWCLILIINAVYHTVVQCAVIDLGGSNVWDFYTRTSAQNISGKAVQVPGDIYADLQNLNFIEEPLFGNRDQEYKWVSRQKWTYERTFQLSENVTKASILLLHLEGLDSIAQVQLNGQFLLRGENQFISHVVDIRNYLKDGQNSIRIVFESPVEQASKRGEDYAALHLHKLPPDCTAEVQNGECGAQFLRKIQASFSWDWGPAFPTVGIWKPIFIEYFVDLPLSIVDFHPVVLPKTDAFLVQAPIQLACPTNFSGLIEVKISVDDLALSQASLILMQSCSSSIPTSIEVELEVPKNGLELWYPRGYGDPALYTLTITVNTSDGKLIGRKSKKIGFRTVELLQDLVDENLPEKGRNFYFKINEIPIFLKGCALPGFSSKHKSVFTIAALLDPRTARHVPESKLEGIDERIVRLYALTHGREEEASLDDSEEQVNNDIDDLLGHPPPKKSKNSSTLSKEVELYMPMIIRTQTKMPALEFWEANYFEFPRIYKLAMSVLPIPAASSSSERVFSNLMFHVKGRKGNSKPKLIKTRVLVNFNEKHIAF